MVLAIPGPTNALLTASAGLVGVRGSLHLITAELSGYAISIGLLLVVSESAFVSFPSLMLVVRAALAFYLIWLAACLWIGNGTQPVERSSLVTWGRVFVTTLLNPKGAVFAFGIFPHHSSFSGVVMHTAAFALTTPVMATGWVMFGASLERLAGRRGVAVLPRVTALTLLAFAAILAGSATS